MTSSDLRLHPAHDAVHLSEPSAGEKSALPSSAVTTRIANAVAAAALQKLNLDDSQDDFVTWLESFTP